MLRPLAPLRALANARALHSTAVRTEQSSREITSDFLARLMKQSPSTTPASSGSQDAARSMISNLGHPETSDNRRQTFSPKMVGAHHSVLTPGPLTRRLQRRRPLPSHVADVRKGSPPRTRRQDCAEDRPVPHPGPEPRRPREQPAHVVRVYRRLWADQEARRDGSHMEVAAPHGQDGPQGACDGCHLTLG